MLTNLQSGKYEIIRELAQGGMGKIYLARHTTLNRNVAIKALHSQYSSDEAFIERFLREARAMAQLDHPNIVSVYDVFEDKGSYYIVMEFCPGQSLDEKIKSTRHLSGQYTLDIALQVARGLQYAHDRDIIHRDIKPANIMVDENARVKLTDFGIAAAKNLSGLTATGQVIGSPQYMSPEQAAGGELDGRSDLYSLGMVMYKMLSGKTPLEGLSLISIMGKLVYQAEDLEYQYPETVPVPISDLIDQLVQRDPAKRIASANLLIEKIQNLIQIQNGVTAPAEKDYDDATEFLSASGVQTAIAQRADQATAAAGGSAVTGLPPPRADQKKLFIGGAIAATVLVTGLITYMAIRNPETVNVPPPDVAITTAQEPFAPVVTAPPRATKPGSQLVSLKDTVTQLAQSIKDKFRDAATAAQDELLKQQLRTASELETKGRDLSQQATAAYTEEKYGEAESMYQDANRFLMLARDQYDNIVRTASLVSDINFLHAEANSLDALFNMVAANRKYASDADAKSYAIAKYREGLNAEKTGLEALDKSRAAILNRRHDEAKKHLAQARRQGELANIHFQEALATAETTAVTEQVAKLKHETINASTDANQARLSAISEDARQFAQARFTEASAQEARAKNSLSEAERLDSAGMAKQAAQPYHKAIALFKSAERDYLNAAKDARAMREERTARDNTNRASNSQTDQEIVSSRLLNFKKAYGEKDLAELEQITQMSPSRREFLKRLFNSYDAIEISISSFAINAKGSSAQAVIRIEKLANKTGDQVIPGDSWKDASVALEKTGENWGKIKW